MHFATGHKALNELHAKLEQKERDWNKLTEVIHHEYEVCLLINSSKYFSACSSKTEGRAEAFKFVLDMMDKIERNVGGRPRMERL